MEFLVHIEGQVVCDLSPDEIADLRVREQARGEELFASGAIRRIWRIPGRRANVGIWVAEDAGELHELLVSLPAHTWQDVTVTALAPHPLEVPAAQTDFEQRL